MGVVQQREYKPLDDVNDPDDYRPNSSIAVVLDPARADGPNVNTLAVLFEHVAPGDRIPLHVHTMDELIVIDAGKAEVTLGDVQRTIGAGAVVFIPAGTPHGTRNVGSDVLDLHAVFPSSIVSIQYLDRNPAPGTEGDAPMPPITYDLRTWAAASAAESIQPQ